MGCTQLKVAQTHHPRPGNVSPLQKVHSPLLQHTLVSQGGKSSTLSGLRDERDEILTMTVMMMITWKWWESHDLRKKDDKWDWMYAGVEDGNHSCGQQRTEGEPTLISHTWRWWHWCLGCHGQQKAGRCLCQRPSSHWSWWQNEYHHGYFAELPPMSAAAGDHSAPVCGTKKLHK